jgi:endonuclease G
MNESERLARLKSMLAQTAPGGTIESVMARRPAAAAPGAGEELELAVPEAERHVERGLEKMAENREQEVTPEERFHLEAIIMPQNRPVVFIRTDRYDDLSGIWTSLNAADVRARLTPRLSSIGRIELPHATWLPYGGTGFIVGTNLLMTNRHVARLFADGLGPTQRLSYHPGDAAIDFHRQVDSPADDRTAYFNVVKVEMIHPYWDMALLRVDGLSDGFTPLTLSVRVPEELVGRNIIAVGYPARDDRNDLELQDQIFGRQYNVKRLQPGQLRARERYQSFENFVNAMTHDSSTLGGNSGSAVIDVDTGEVVGLHFAGEYLKANYAVPTYELARDQRVVDVGLNFGGSVAATNDWSPAWTRVEAAEVSPNGSVAPAVSSTQTVAPRAGTATGSTAIFNVPLTIAVSIGQPTLAGSAAPLAAAAIEAPRMQPPVIFGGLEHRTGYQGGFLDLEDDATVPLPELTSLGASVVAKLEDGTHELKYHKFSVVIHRGRRMALFTASNVDWRPAMRTIDGKKPGRDELDGLPQGTQEQWVTDWRIPKEQQLPDVFYTEDGGAFDKGHIVRRDDVAWGKTFEDMQKGNGDTFHTTNCSPQTAAFNRSTLGEDNWGDLEILVQKETRAEKAIIFAGPVLADDDRRFKGRDEAGTILVQIPSRFWKIVVVKGAAGPDAYGFLLEQDLSRVPLEFAVPPSWRPHMCEIAQIEALLNGLARLDWLQNVDRFDSSEGVRIKTQLGGS